MVFFLYRMHRKPIILGWPHWSSRKLVKMLIRLWKDKRLAHVSLMFLCVLFNDSWLWVFAMRKYQREKEAVLENIMRLSIQSEKKHNLELDIKHLMRQLQVMELKPEDEDSGLGKKIDELKEELSEKITELNDAESFNQTLIARESKNSDELREAREVLIDV